MIDFYTWKTPNGQKVAIMLEELGLPYKTHLVDLSQRDQFKPNFLKINPNNKIPAIVDRDGPHQHPFNLFESGAILIYLAEKTGQFLSQEPCQKAETIQWLMFQMSGVGPMLGQLHHFLHYAAERIPYAVERYINEAKRLYNVMEEHLENKSYFTDEYSIADIAIFPWVNLYERQRIDLEDYPHLKAWHHRVGQRPAVHRAYKLTENIG